jgi:Flp pilus assembly protein TadD
LQNAVRLEPGDFSNWYLLGRYGQYSLDEPDLSGSITNFRHALSLNPRAADVWLDLAAVYEAQGNISGAQEAFVQARHAYPISAAVAWQYGNFLLRQGKVSDAFAEIRRATYTEPKRSAEAFSRCWRVNPDPLAVVEAVIPPDRDAYLVVIRQLASANQIAAAEGVWQRLLSVSPRMNPSDAIFFADALIQRGEIAKARQVWDQAAQLSAIALTDPADSVLWDGGFESGVRGGGFAWAFPAGSAGVQAAFDTRQKHSGKQSLRLFFDGKHNANYDGVCNNLAVQPDTTYRFTAWLRAQSLTTDEGVRFRLQSWSDRGTYSYFDSQDTRGTQPWTPMEMSWTSPKDVQRARMCISRTASRGMNPYIQGTVWIDDIALVPVGKPQR